MHQIWTRMLGLQLYEHRLFHGVTSQQDFKIKWNIFISNIVWKNDLLFQLFIDFNVVIYDNESLWHWQFGSRFTTPKEKEKPLLFQDDSFNFPDKMLWGEWKKSWKLVFNFLFLRNILTEMCLAFRR